MKYLLAFVLAASSAGCWFDQVKEPLQTTLEKCRNEARGAYYNEDAGIDESAEVYAKCLAREGLK